MPKSQAKLVNKKLTKISLLNTNKTPNFGHLLANNMRRTYKKIKKTLLKVIKNKQSINLN